MRQFQSAANLDTLFRHMGLCERRVQLHGQALGRSGAQGSKRDRSNLPEQEDVV